MSITDPFSVLTGFVTILFESQKKKYRGYQGDILRHNSMIIILVPFSLCKLSRKGRVAFMKNGRLTSADKDQVAFRFWSNCHKLIVI